MLDQNLRNSFNVLILNFSFTFVMSFMFMNNSNSSSYSKDINIILISIWVWAFSSGEMIFFSLYIRKCNISLSCFIWIRTKRGRFLLRSWWSKNLPPWFVRVICLDVEPTWWIIMKVKRSELFWPLDVLSWAYFCSVQLISRFKQFVNCKRAREHGARVARPRKSCDE